MCSVRRPCAGATLPVPALLVFSLAATLVLAPTLLTLLLVLLAVPPLSLLAPAPERLVGLLAALAERLALLAERGVFL